MTILRIKGRTYTFSEFVKTGSLVLYYEVFVPIVLMPSRLLFGNFVGFRNNVLPLLKLGLNKLRSPNAAVGDPGALKFALKLHTLGHVEFAASTGPIAQAGCDLESIVVKYNEHIDSSTSALAGLGERILYIHKPLEKIPEIAGLITPQLDAIVRAYYRSAYRIQSVRAWRNHHVPHDDSQKDVGLSNAFHHDGLPRTDLRLFVLLCDGVTRETGATRFHDKPASRSLSIDPGYFSRRWQTRRVKERLLDPSTLRFFEGNIGDACLMNTQECIHGSSIPRPGTFRDIVAFEIVPTNDPVKLEDVFSGMREDDLINPKLMPFRSA